jgi:tyrosyl-tRNA synthetase
MQLILSDLEARGLIHTTTDREAFLQIPSGTPFYFGVDPTASSLHVGNLLPMVVAMRLAKGGLKPILLFGGSTGAIGDPGGRSIERPLLSREEIDLNVESISLKVREIFERHGLSAEYVNNYSWTKDVSVINFLRDVGKHFPVASMLAKDSVKTRLHGEGISFTEMSYMLLQAFDYQHLYDQYKCMLQIGGSDQWGNMTAGLDLLSRTRGVHAHVLSTPLLTDSSGKKFGKSQGGAVWICEKLLSPYEFYQFFINVEDSMVEQLLNFYTFLPYDEIKEVMKEHFLDPSQRSGQRKLASSVTEIVHGRESVAFALKASEVLFGGSVEGVKDTDLLSLFSHAPSSSLERAQLTEMTLLDVLVHASVCSSKGEARRLVQAGGIYVNNVRVTDPQAQIETQGRAVVLLRSGKKAYHLLKLDA